MNLVKNSKNSKLLKSTAKLKILLSSIIIFDYSTIYCTRKQIQKLVIITITWVNKPPFRETQKKSIRRTSQFSHLPNLQNFMCVRILASSSFLPISCQHHQHRIKFYFPLISSSDVACFVFYAERLNWFKIEGLFRWRIIKFLVSISDVVRGWR